MMVRLCDQVRPKAATDRRGVFGCPGCWQMTRQLVAPADAICPDCGVRLDWAPDALRVAQESMKGRKA